ncbi:hypothetical protein THER5_1172 [Bifidobacterium thermacidophilum subsp. thermacidophilum]|uniref:Uncharacterized protein n=1 Tax=Bifidobacterium thermacidophilum subsp. thermacidophilum TaxID=79262 RepID=A0A087E4K5_9BIFI|nr:hypothetical protein THER5_1172 [Bifidobacterium thermacidophilum subsp. thermacidophilum]
MGETPRKTLGFGGICQIVHVRACGPPSHIIGTTFSYTPILLMRLRIRHGMACQLRAEQFIYRFLQWMHMCSACHRHHGTTGVI